MKIRSSRAVVGLAAAALAVSAGPALAAGSGASPAFSPTATVASTLAQATSLGAAPASTTLPLTVTLRPNDEAGLNALLAEQADPASAQYHRYLTPAQFTARFGATDAQVASVVSYLRQQGLRVESVSPNHLAIRAVGSAADAGRAFDTPLGLFRQDGRQVVANTAAAQVPASLAGTVESVIGLDQATQMSTAPEPTAGLTGSSTSYNPPQLATAYDASGLPAATGTSIAIMAEGNLTQVVKDLRTEEAANGLPQVPVTIIPTGASSTDTSGLDEWDLDTQTSTAMAGNVQNLYLYDAPSLTDPSITTEIEAFVSQDKASVGSASFGECDTDAMSDGTTSAVDTALKEAVAQGQTLFASSGDSGSQCSSTEGISTGPTETSYPASGTYTTGVGGTTLSTTSSGAYSGETAWDGSGGGRSSEATPSWAVAADATAPAASSGGGGGLGGLLTVPATTGLSSFGGLQGFLNASRAAARHHRGGTTGSTSATSSGRGVPDLAMDADPNTGANIVVNGSVETVGGTSLASPLAAGGWARLQQAHGGTLGDAGEALYGLYNAANGSNAGPTPGLHDVTSGSNGAYSAATGYDLVTGLGTMDVGALNSKV